MKNKLLKCFSYGSLLVYSCYIFYTRFSNPDLTETQLFLKFWKGYTIGFVIESIIISIYLKFGGK